MVVSSGGRATRASQWHCKHGAVRSSMNRNLVATVEELGACEWLREFTATRCSAAEEAMYVWGGETNGVLTRYNVLHVAYVLRDGECSVLRVSEVHVWSALSSAAAATQDACAVSSWPLEVYWAANCAARGHVAFQTRVVRRGGTRCRR